MQSLLTPDHISKPSLKIAPWGCCIGLVSLWPSLSEAFPSPQGEEVLRQLQTLAPQGVKVRITVSKPNGPQPQADLQALLQSGELGGAGVRLGLGLPKLAPDHHPCRLQVPRSAWWTCKS